MRHRRALVIAITASLVLALIGLYQALGSPSSREAAEPTAPAPSDPAGRPLPRGTPATGIPAVTDAPSADPATFAAQVAHALFDWDTTAPYSPANVAGRLLAVADPTGLEASGLAADVAGYVPTPDGWAFLRSYYTRQWLEIESLAVPARWQQAVAEAGPGGLAAGTTAYTVEGVRHRDGVWDGSSVSSQHDVAFTVFMVCAPSYATCHLLRLSRLDEPLD